MFVSAYPLCSFACHTEHSWDQHQPVMACNNMEDKGTEGEKKNPLPILSIFVLVLVLSIKTKSISPCDQWAAFSCSTASPSLSVCCKHQMQHEWHLWWISLRYFGANIWYHKLLIVPAYCFFLTIAQTTKVPCNVRLYNKGLTNKIFGVDPFVFVLYVVPEM